MTEQTHTDIAMLAPSDRAVIVLNSTKTEADLRAMVEEATEITAVNDKDGRDQAHRVGMKLKNARTTIQKTGKSARDDATAFCKAVIDEEKRLIAITEGEEKRVIGLRDAYDARIEAEKQAKARRDAEIKEKIAGIRALPLALATASSDEIAAEKAALEEFTPPDDVFGEHTEDCKAALAEAVAALSDLHARVMAQETASALVEAERRRVEEASAQERERLAAERAALEAERRAYEAERAAFEAQRKAMEKTDEAPTGSDAPASPAAQDGSIAEPSEQETAPIEEAIEAVTESGYAVVSAPSIADWKIRRAAMHTADQFAAMAGKVEQCGFGAFAEELRAVATALRNGTHDSALAGADREALVAADTLMLDATVECIDSLNDQREAA